MRLKWCVRIATGLLASSGVAVILSGGALAASNGQDTTSQVVQFQPGGAPVPPTNGGAGGSMDVQNGQSDNIQQAENGQPSVIATGLNSGQPEDGQQGDNNAYTNGAQIANSSNPKPPQKPVNSASDNTGNQNKSATGVTLSSDKGGPVALGNGGSGNNAVSVSEVAVVTPAVTQDAPLRGTADQTIRTTILPIQPVITNRSFALTPDLAESMPSAPAPARAHVPAKSSGVLAGLVVGLANVVVPQPVTPIDSAALKLMIPVAMMTLVILLANVFEFSYGQWLRRGGFATAARSDEPLSRSITPLFATPLLSGYVKRPPRLYSPIPLLVLVPNAYRKEDRR